MNKTISMGRLTSDPKITETASGKKMARFTMALDRYKEGADYPSFIAWDKKAEFLEMYCHKGIKLLVEGRIHTDLYDKDGKKIKTTDIVCDNIEFCEKKREPEEGIGENSDDGFMKIPDGIDQELPFN